MFFSLPYGIKSELHFDLDPAAVIADCQGPRGASLDDIAAATRRALSKPVEFPALVEAVVPGDRVAIAVEPDVPQASAVVQAVVETLTGAGVRPEHITVLTVAANGNCEDLNSTLASVGPVAVALHDPANRNQLSYLANLPSGKPVYLNRAVCEADFIVPIGTLRLRGTHGYQSVFDGLFPTFADAQVVGRFRSPVAADSALKRKRLRKQMHEVGWLVGASFAVRRAAGSRGCHLGYHLR